ncbi:MAG: radical SAM protein [archaeon]|nr:radical SAM protein [archaeon]
MNNIETANKLSNINSDELSVIFKKDEAIRKAFKILIEADEQSKRKDIIIKKELGVFIKNVKKIKLMLKYGIHWNKPLYPFRLARNLILSRIYRLFKIKKFVLRGCEFDITFRCNFSCRHCSVARLGEKNIKEELGPEDYHNIVAQAMALGAISFGIEGGEPFVKKNWDRIIEACRPKYNHIIISSNGFLFDEHKAKKCAELGVDTINFSLDSGIPELHDFFRRKNGSFDRVMKAVKLCKKYKIKVFINTVVHKKNLYTEGFRRLLDYADREGLFINILFAKAIGNFKEEDNFILDDDDFRAYKEITQPYACVLVHHDTQMSYGRKGCNGTKEMLQFTPFGDVMNCAHTHIYFGNIKTEPLKRIRERALECKPFGLYNSCYHTQDKDFMSIYKKLLENKPYASLSEFIAALRTYEKDHKKVLYSR